MVRNVGLDTVKENVYVVSKISYIEGFQRTVFTIYIYLSLIKIGKILFQIYDSRRKYRYKKKMN